MNEGENTRNRSLFNFGGSEGASEGSFVPCDLMTNLRVGSRDLSTHVALSGRGSFPVLEDCVMCLSCALNPVNYVTVTSEKLSHKSSRRDYSPTILSIRINPRL